MAFLIGGTGFPVSSQENPNRLVIEEQDTVIIKLSGNRLIIENLPKDEILRSTIFRGKSVSPGETGTTNYPFPGEGLYPENRRITKKICCHTSLTVSLCYTILFISL